MHDRPATKKDIDGLKTENRVVAIAIPVVVAGIALLGVWITAHKQDTLERELVTLRSQVEARDKVILEKNSTYGRMVAEKEMNFFKEANSVLGDVDTNFQAECFFAGNQKNKKLAESLDLLRKLT